MVSRNMDSICSILGAEKFSDHFKFNLKDRLPSLILAVCAIIGGFLAAKVLSAADYSVSISSATVEMLNDYSIPHSQGLQPDTIFNWAFLASPQGLILLVLGGFMIGFGVRWAIGCTSGHILLQA